MLTTHDEVSLIPALTWIQLALLWLICLVINEHMPLLILKVVFRIHKSFCSVAMLSTYGSNMVATLQAFYTEYYL